MTATTAAKNTTLNVFNPGYFIIALAIFAGIILTIVSLMQLCSEECTEAHNYRLFGTHFEIFGMAFFISLALVHAFLVRFPICDRIESLLFASGLGAEAAFIWVQKYTIGSWCPVCLGIATCVAIGTGVHMVQGIKNLKYFREEKMRILTRMVSATGVFFITMVIALFGVTKYDAMEAAQISIRDGIAFGDKKETVEVYLFTDWECPACRKLEPLMESLASSIISKARLIFVDHAIHPETLNFTPYNLSFMLHNKPEYFKLRKMLTEISKKTGNPSEEQITAAASKLGVTYSRLNYSDIALGMKYFKKLGEKFSVNVTPTLIIINTTTKKGKKLTGLDDITEKNIFQAIDELKRA